MALGMNMQIIIVGTCAPGGIKTVIDQHLESLEKCGGLRRKYIASHIEANRFRKAIVFIKCISTLVGSLVRTRLGCYDALVHLHVSMRGSVLRKYTLLLVSKAFGAKCVLHLHGSETKSYLENIGIIEGYFVRHLYKKSDVVLVLSVEWKQYIDDFFSIESIVLSNYITDPVRSCLGDETLFYESTRPVKFIFLGAYIHRKGVDQLLEAANILCSRGFRSGDFNIAIYGDGPLRIEYESAIKSNSLEDIVYLGQWLDYEGKINALLASDCLVLPSRAEGLPMVIIEAMATYNAVISTDVGGIKAMINAGGGECITVDDNKRLAEAMSRYIESIRQLESAKQASRKGFEENYNEVQVAQKLVSIYKELLSL
jgi:glycosyltransferase involved in cell wall biosynthesis